MVAKVPLKLPKGVLTALTITASLILRSLFLKTILNDDSVSILAESKQAQPRPTEAGALFTAFTAV
jgi:hypothetical protein